MQDDLLYQNNNYYVKAAAEEFRFDEYVSYPNHYVVVNIRSGIIEYRTPCYPDALRMAAQWDVQLVKETHNWVYEENDEAGAETQPLLVN